MSAAGRMRAIDPLARFGESAAPSRDQSFLWIGLSRHAFAVVGTDAVVCLSTPRRIKMKRQQLAYLFLIGVVALLSWASQAFAREPVDPSTLNPPPPPEFNPVCKSIGNGTICTVTFSDPPFSGGSGIICGSGANTYEVLQFQNRSVHGTRYYDQNGNLIRRHFHEVVSGTVTNPLTHTALSYKGHGNTMHDLSTLGDITSGTVTFTGTTHVFNPHGGSVFFESGRIVSAASDGSFIRESGPHPLLDYFVFGNTSGIQPLCDALE
jgi:hypothetical protein